MSACIWNYSSYQTAILLSFNNVLVTNSDIIRSENAKMWWRVKKHNQPDHLSLGHCLVRSKPDLDFKIRLLIQWGCKQRECSIRNQFLQTNAKPGPSFYQDIGIYQFYPNKFDQNVFVKMFMYFQVTDRELIKEIVWTFHWHLLIVVRHFLIQWICPGTGFMVSRIQIRFQKNWPKQTRILKPVSILV